MKRQSVCLVLLCFVSLLAVCFNSLPTTEAVTYYTVEITGPRYLTGEVVNGSVTVSVYWTGYTILGDPTVFTMTADGVTANTTILSNISPPSQIMWNSSSLLNYTGVIDFLPYTNPINVRLYVPSPDVPSAQYAFSISDLGANMVNPYLQISASDGLSYTAERRNLNASSTVYFSLTQYRPYTLTVICDQGSYVQSFFAENVFLTNLPVLAGSFPLTNASTLPIFEASRLNSSMIGLVYSDSTLGTDWLSYTISHKNGLTTVNDYTGNTTGNSQTILWNYADANINYNVNAIASIDDVLYSWDIPVLKTASTNPFTGAFDWLGKNTSTLPQYYVGWPNGMTSAQIAQLVGCGVILLFLGIGSYKNAGASCVMAWCAGGIMMAMGWFNGGASQAGASSIPLFAFGGFLALLIHIQEKKSEGAGLS